MENNKKRRPRKKICYYCANGIEQIDYKDTETLNKHLNFVCKIIPKRTSGCCTKHQRRVANAIKRARILALLPYTTN